MSRKPIKSITSIKKDNSSNIESLVNDLFKSKDILKEEDVIRELRIKLNNDDKLISKTLNFFTKRYNVIQKKAEEFKEKLMDKYSNLPISDVLEKAREYGDKYKFTDQEFQLFINIIKYNQFGKFNKYEFVESTPMGNALGYEVKPKTTKLNMKNGNDKIIVEKIIALYYETQVLDKRIKIQSLTYNDSSILSLTGKFDESRNTIYKYVHPILAALFIPKISVLEERMVMTNIAGLVTKLSKGDQILDYPTKQLYDDLVTDPNQTVEFSGSNVFDDLMNRSLIQIKLWEAIHCLRLGRYYDFDSTQFDSILSKYPASIFDAPDLAYVHDAGNILRRLLNAFSFRPTLVSVSKIQNSFNPLSFENYIVSNSNTNEKTPTFVPMINIRLPPINNTKDIQPNIQLSDTISSSQWFTTNKYNPTVYNQNIISSNGVLFFYINRSYSTVNYGNKYNTHEQSDNIYLVNQLPLMFNEIQKVNIRPVDANLKMLFGNSTFLLRSVVCAETFGLIDSEINMNSSTVIIDHNSNNYYYYHPHSAGRMNDGTVVDPVGLLSNNPSYGITFNETVRKYGIVYMYVRETL